MMRTIHVGLMLLVVLFLSCASIRAFFSETGKITRKAESLYKDMTEILENTAKGTKEVSLLAVDEAFRLDMDPKVMRVIARTAATVLAEEAVTLILKNQGKKLDRIFGADRYNAVSSMILNTYCIPAIEEIIEAAIDKKLQETDIATSGNQAAAEIDTIIKSYLDRFDLEDAVDFIKGIATRKRLPDYFDTLDILPVNTTTYASTKNWKDKGLVYQYRIINDKIGMKRSDEEWKELTMPQSLIPRNIAADNNRLFVLTQDNQLWWYCVKQDQAQWSIDIMNTAVEIMSLKPLLAEDVCDIIIPHVTTITDTVAAMVSDNPFLTEWQGLGKNASKEYWETRCKAWGEIILSIDKLLLKSAEGKSFTAADYAAWSRQAHAEGAWTNLVAWSAGDESFTRGENIRADEIQDIAVGNWNGTVVTMYVLAKGEIWYIDEEIIHHEWKPIRQWNSDWAVIKKTYHDIKQSPYPLGTECNIDASNSVIAVSKLSTEGSELYWIRWDYHQKDDFVYWPLDWCEHGWYKVSYSSKNTAEFRINTMGTIDPREDNTVWSVPAPAFTFHNYLPAEGYKGIFGDVQREDVSTYPVTVSVKNESGENLYFSINQAKDLAKSTIAWKIY